MLGDAGVSATAACAGTPMATPGMALAASTDGTSGAAFKRLQAASVIGQLLMRSVEARSEVS